MKAVAFLLTFAMAGVSVTASAPASTAPASTAQGLTGDWITPNHSIVRIYSCNGDLCARIAHVDAAVGHATDGQNPDTTRRNRPLCGLVIGKGFKQKDPAHAQGGTLYDPESGKTYSGTLTLAGDSVLKLRGYVGISLFGRSEEWRRTSETPDACSALKG